MNVSEPRSLPPRGPLPGTPGPSSPWDAIRALVDASSRRPGPRPAVRSPGRAGASFASLKREIKARGLLDRQPGHYAARITLTIGFHAAAIAGLVALRASPWEWAFAPVLAFSSVQLVLLAHDAAHRAIFASRRANEVLAVLLINLLNGGSAGWWTASHNEHHARSNDPDLDPDVDYPILALREDQAARKHPAARPWIARQHWIAWPLMTLVGLNLRVYSAAWLRRRGRATEIAAFALFYLTYPPLVIGALGAARGIAFIAAQQAIFGLYLGLVTAANHWGMPMPSITEDPDFLRQQVSSSRNVAGPLCDLLYGGLNRQIEHHLFPTMPRDKLAEAAPLVRERCAALGIPYHEVSPARAYREIWTTLRRVARSVRAEETAETTPLSPIHPEETRIR